MDRDRDREREGATGAMVAPVAPEITGQPVGGEYDGVDPFEITGLAYTPPGATVQWQESPAGAGTWSDVVGETDDTLEVEPDEATDYRAVVTHDGISVNSNTAAVTLAAPEITVEPATQVFRDSGGSNATASITAVGPALTYQWYRGRIAASLTLLNGAHDDVDTTLAVDDGSVFFVGDVIQAAGNTEKMMVTGIAGNVLTVRRAEFGTSGQSMGDNVAINAIEQSISGQTTANYSAQHNVTTNPAARIFCRVTNDGGSVDSDPCGVHVSELITDDGFTGGDDADISGRTWDNAGGGSGTRTWQLRDTGNAFAISGGKLTWTNSAAQFRRCLSSDKIITAQGMGVRLTDLVLTSTGMYVMLRDSGADGASFRATCLFLEAGTKPFALVIIPTNVSTFEEISALAATVDGGNNPVVEAYVFDTASGIQYLVNVNGVYFVKSYTITEIAGITGAQLADYASSVANAGVRSYGTNPGTAAMETTQVRRMHLGQALIAT